jgi:hypothetical protein
VVLKKSSGLQTPRFGEGGFRLSEFWGLRDRVDALILRRVKSGSENEIKSRLKSGKSGPMIAFSFSGFWLTIFYYVLWR